MVLKVYVEAKIAYFTVIDPNGGTSKEKRTDSSTDREQKANFKNINCKLNKLVEKNTITVGRGQKSLI
jgi:hypothetical protein